jgi:hypothetical protein
VIQSGGKSLMKAVSQTVTETALEVAITSTMVGAKF